MKKLMIFGLLLSGTSTLKAQTLFNPVQDKEMFADILHISASIVGIYLISTFILAVLKIFLDNKLKSTMIENDLSEESIHYFLNSNKVDLLNIAIKWFAILLGLSIGLTIIYFVNPAAIYGAAILLFTLALSFLGYYFFLKKTV